MSSGSQRTNHYQMGRRGPKLDAAREQLGIYFIVDDLDFEEIIHNARRKLEIRKASAMPCNVTTPANPNGSSWLRPCASECSKMERTNWILHVQSTIIEPQRIRTTDSAEKTHRGHVSMSHRNMVHKPIPTPKAMQNPEANAALDSAWKTLQKLLACDESKVTSEAEVIRQAKLEGKKVRLATLINMCHLKDSELEKKFQKCKGRVVWSCL